MKFIWEVLPKWSSSNNCWSRDCNVLPFTAKQSKCHCAPNGQRVSFM